jgi:anti-sigma regulatory factor (Ser/Thr protein kinase)
MFCSIESWYGANGQAYGGNPDMNQRHAQVQLTAGRWSLTAAQMSVRQALTDWGFTDPERLQLSQLIATELVANAVRHVGEDFTLQIAADARTVTLAVHDPSPVLPVRRAPDEHGGRGLMIVERLCASWGYDTYRDDGKRVWARLDW